MPADADEIVVAANGTVSVAPTGTALPVEPDTTLNAAFVDLGHISEDGATFSDSKDMENIGAWKGRRPVRRIITGQETTLSFAMRQWNGTTVKLGFGGGAVTETPGGAFRYTPPGPEVIDERAMVVDWQDGDYVYRLVIPKGIVSDAVETNLTKSGPADLPITFSSTPDEGQDGWYLLTDDPAFDPAP